LLIFLDVHPVHLRKIIFVWRKNPSLLCIPPIIKQALAKLQELYPGNHYFEGTLFVFR